MCEHMQPDRAQAWFLYSVRPPRVEPKCTSSRMISMPQSVSAIHMVFVRGLWHLSDARASNDLGKWTAVIALTLPFLKTKAK